MRRVWLMLVCTGLLCLWACAPRYTSRVEQEPPRPPVSETELEGILQKAATAYDTGLEYFVREKFDSAAPFNLTSQ